MHVGAESLRVDPGVLHASHHELESIAEELRAGLRRLESAVEGVVGSSWRGKASEAFDEYWRSVRDPAQRVVEDAYVIAELVGDSATQYVGQESANARAVGSAGGVE